MAVFNCVECQRCTEFVSRRRLMPLDMSDFCMLLILMVLPPIVIGPAALAIIGGMVQEQNISFLSYAVAALASFVSWSPYVALRHRQWGNLVRFFRINIWGVTLYEATTMEAHHVHLTGIDSSDSEENPRWFGRDHVSGNLFALNGNPVIGHRVGGWFRKHGVIYGSMAAHWRVAFAWGECIRLQDRCGGEISTSDALGLRWLMSAISSSAFVYLVQLVKTAERAAELEEQIAPMQESEELGKKFVLGVFVLMHQLAATKGQPGRGSSKYAQAVVAFCRALIDSAKIGPIDPSEIVHASLAAAEVSNPVRKLWESVAEPILPSLSEQTPA